MELWKEELREELNELTKEQLVTKVMELIENNSCLENENEDLKYTVTELKSTDAIKTAKIANLFISYKNVQNRYDYNNIEYQMKNLDDITKVFGITMYDVKGFSDLREQDQVIFQKGILEFLNNWGLGDRHRHLPTKVWKEGNEFRFNTLSRTNDLFEYMNEKGQVY